MNGLVDFLFMDEFLQSIAFRQRIELPVSQQMHTT